MCITGYTSPIASLCVYSGVYLPIPGCVQWCIPPYTRVYNGVYTSLCIYPGVQRWYTSLCVYPGVYNGGYPPCVYPGVYNSVYNGGIPGCTTVCTTVVYPGVQREARCAERCPFSLGWREACCAESPPSSHTPVRVNISNSFSHPGLLFPFHCWVLIFPSPVSLLVEVDLSVTRFTVGHTLRLYPHDPTLLEHSRIPATYECPKINIPGMVNPWGIRQVE